MKTSKKGKKAWVFFLLGLFTFFLMLSGGPKAAETGIIAFIGGVMIKNLALLLGIYIYLEVIKGSSLFIQKEEISKWYYNVSLKDNFLNIFGKLVASLFVMVIALVLPVLLLAFTFFGDIFFWIVIIFLVATIPICAWLAFKFMVMSFRIIEVLIKKLIK